MIGIGGVVMVAGVVFVLLALIVFVVVLTARSRRRERERKWRQLDSVHINRDRRGRGN